VLHHQILSGKQFGELGFDFVVDGHWSPLRMRPLLQKKEVRRPPSGRFKNWF